MKKIELITRPDKLEEVKEALNELEIHGMTVSMVSGCGLQKGKKEIYRGTVYDINLLPKIKVEIVVKDSDVERLCSLVIQKVRTGNIGDGKIFIFDVQEAIRIRTGEHGDNAV
jgi:nitrogen regulatory protein P-II 1